MDIYKELNFASEYFKHFNSIGWQRAKSTYSKDEIVEAFRLRKKIDLLRERLRVDHDDQEAFDELMEIKRNSNYDQVYSIILMIFMDAGIHNLEKDLEKFR